MDNLNQDTTQTDKPFSPTDFIRLCFNNWKWFLASIAVALIIGWLYGKQAEPVYQSTASVLIKEQNNGRSMMDVSQAFSNMGLVNSNVSVNNELIAFTSPSIMYEVVKRMGLQVSYVEKGSFHDNVLYGTNLPIQIGFSSLPENGAASLKIILEPSGRATLYDFMDFSKENSEKDTRHIAANWNLSTVRTPLGNITIRRNPEYKGRLRKPLEITVWRNGLQQAVDSYCHSLKGTLHDKMADVIDLRCTSLSPQMAQDILKNVIEVYNEKWVEDKNIIAHATSDFINDRLAVIEKDLGVVDADISNYKSEHLVPDIKEASRMYLEKSVKSEEELLDLNNKLMVARYMRDFVVNPANASSVLPVNTGIGDVNIETQIGEYNSMLLARNNILANSGRSRRGTPADSFQSHSGQISAIGRAPAESEGIALPLPARETRGERTHTDLYLI